MATADRVQIWPGIPRFFARTLSTSWVQLPSVPGCVSVFIRPRAENAAAIYVSHLGTPAPSAVDRIELATTDSGITLDIDNPNLLWVASASGTPVLEVVCIIGVK